MMRIAATALSVCAADSAWAIDPARPLPKAGEAVDLLRWSLAMVAVLAAILILAWLMRRLGQISSFPSGRFRVLAAVPVGPRERVVLLQAGDKQLILGVTPGRVQTLCVLEQADLIGTAEQEPLDDAAVGFSKKLAELLSRKPA